MSVAGSIPQEGRAGERISRALSGRRGASGRDDSERGQALVRVVITVVMICYTSVGLYMQYLPPETATYYIIYFVVFLSMSVGHYVRVVRNPGISHARRIASVVFDFGNLTFFLSIGSPFMSPLMAVMVSVTVGYGMRYGTDYLIGATVAAMIGLAIIAFASPYWRAEPFALAAFAITMLLVPLYASMLLTDTRDAYSAAQEANLTKSRFLAQASHDLRQPIHAISLFTSVLKDSGLRPDERQLVTNIEQSLQTVTQMFRSLLDVAILDSGQVTPQPQPALLAEVIGGLVRQNAEAARRGEVTLRVVPTTARVMTDPALLTVMIQNLISNAIKYAPGSTVLIGVRRRRGGRISVIVADRGPGVAAAHQPHLFAEFYRVPSSGRDVEGVGLGLSIVARMARLIEVGVKLRSIPGQGTAVELSGLAPTLAVAPWRPASPAPPPSLLNGLRVVLIDDEAAVLQSTCQLMERWGCAVQAFDGPDFAARPCDLIVADYDLNDPVSGADVIARLRAEQGRAVPAIIVTAHDPGRIRAALSEPDVTIISKPVRPAELRAIMLAGRVAEGSAA